MPLYELVYDVVVTRRLRVTAETREEARALFAAGEWETEEDEVGELPRGGTGSFYEVDDEEAPVGETEQIDPEDFFE